MYGVLANLDITFIRKCVSCHVIDVMRHILAFKISTQYNDSVLNTRGNMTLW